MYNSGPENIIFYLYMCICDTIYVFTTTETYYTQKLYLLSNFPTILKLPLNFNKYLWFQGTKGIEVSRR